MATRNPLVLVSGQQRELAAGDTLPAAAVPAVVAAEVHAAASKTTPADADELGLSDSAAAWALKKLTFANLKAWISGLFVSKSGDTINGNLDFGGTGRRITGDFSNATLSNRTLMQTSAANSATAIGVVPNGTSQTATLNVFSSSTPENSSHGQLAVIGGSEVRLASLVQGSGTFLPMTSYVGGSKNTEQPTSGGLLVVGGGLGYGIGAGGTATQTTSKITAVALNKLTGLITLSNSVLGAGVSARFNVSNSYVGINDTVTVNIAGGVANYESYTVDASIPGAPGAFTIVIKNVSGASLSEAVVLNYSVGKGSAS